MLQHYHLHAFFVMLPQKPLHPTFLEKNGLNNQFSSLKIAARDVDSLCLFTNLFCVDVDRSSMPSNYIQNPSVSVMGARTLLIRIPFHARSIVGFVVFRSLITKINK